MKKPSIAMSKQLSWIQLILMLGIIKAKSWNILSQYITSQKVLWRSSLMLWEIIGDQSNKQICSKELLIIQRIIKEMIIMNILTE